KKRVVAPLGGNPVFIPLDGNSGTQVLSRLAVIQESSFYPAWRQFRNPAFIPLGGNPGIQVLSRLAAIGWFIGWIL
ncbi:hypothetical protein, partial [Cardiobacterium hominis]|uniref:hypothetical protein n=1 Tax=Cardiobacterium hominis TaxID=2718 RepID=UPI0028E7029C